jgi:glyoxylase-like metal-dependent hydrolase (beta-lactamase superfamily II)
MQVRIVQLLSGRDVAASSWSPVNALIFQFAKMLQNFIYIAGCEQTKQCVVVDICWDVDGVLEYIERELGWRLVGAVVTHYHFDHVGGKPPPPYDQYRVKVDGVAALLRKRPGCRAYIHPEDVQSVKDANEDLLMDQIIPTPDHFELTVGSSVHLKFLHTPGHTPGSQCILMNDCRLFSGDTVFIKNCGRLDFPDANADRMYVSAQKLKSEVKDTTVIYPGHNYDGQMTTMGKEKRQNILFLAQSAADLKRMACDD